MLENCAALATFDHTPFGMSQQMAATLGDISADQLFDRTGDQIAIRRAGELTRIAARVDYLPDPILRQRAWASSMFKDRRATPMDRS